MLLDDGRRAHPRSTAAHAAPPNRCTRHSRSDGRYDDEDPSLRWPLLAVTATSGKLRGPMSTLVRGVCPHDCPDSCSWIVTVEDGRAVRMAGDPDHPFTRGFLCTKVARYVERTYHEGRLLFPQIRDGAKGEGKFRRATWDEALDLIATRLRGV